MVSGIDNRRSFDDLLEIFEIQKKSILQKHCRRLVIHGADFARLILLADAGKLPYVHRIYYRESVPKDLRPTLDALPSMRLDKLSTTHKSYLLKRLAQVIRVRRQLVGHIFFDKEIRLWHFFYFDQRDTSRNGNHWNSGPHLHLINHLWTRRDPVLILKDFLEESPHIKGSIHIRFNDKSATENH